MASFPRTAGQCRYALALRSPRPIIIATGPAGCGKTMLACQYAQTHRRTIFTRPIVTVDEDMGYLPGDMDEKMEPWSRPMFDMFDARRSVEIEPLGFMRGRTFNDTVIIADEMQNSTPNQMKMLLTRVGRNTKLIVTGDLSQSDLYSENGLVYITGKMDGLDLTYIVHVKMDSCDIIRHPCITEMLKVLDV